MEKFLEEMMALEIKPSEEESFNMGYFDQYQFDTFLHQIPDRPDAEVISFIRTNIHYMSNKFIQGGFDWDIVTTAKFLRCYYNVLQSIPIDGNIRLATNKMCYEYLLRASKERDESKNVYGVDKEYSTTSDTLMSLCQIANAFYMNKLIAKGLMPIVASDICIARFSSLSENVCIKRMNFMICKSLIPDNDPLCTDNIQMIVWIYEVLFDSISQLFTETMFEYYSPDQEIDLGQDFFEIYSTISLALLTIVNNMPTNAIRTLLSAYYDDWVYRGRPPTRFSLISLSADYSRVRDVAEWMREKKIYIP